MKDYKIHEQAARMIPWSTGITGWPNCDLCSWSYSAPGRTFKLKFRNKMCVKHGNYTNR